MEYTFIKDKKHDGNKSLDGFSKTFIEILDMKSTNNIVIQGVSGIGKTKLIEKVEEIRDNIIHISDKEYYLTNDDEKRNKELSELLNGKEFNNKIIVLDEYFYLENSQKELLLDIIENTKSSNKFVIIVQDLKEIKKEIKYFDTIVKLEYQ